MEQKKIGSFIAELRKEKNLTQTELGERIGVTNKTISRWETGSYMPDLAMIQSLCQELGIGVNEFLSGERLDEQTFRVHAEDNMVCVLDREKKLKKEIKFRDFFIGGGTGILASLIYAPDSPRKILFLVIALTMLCVGGSIRTKIDKNIISSKKY